MMTHTTFRTLHSTACGLIFAMTLMQWLGALKSQQDAVIWMALFILSIGNILTFMGYVGSGKESSILGEK